MMREIKVKLTVLQFGVEYRYELIIGIAKNEFNQVNVLKILKAITRKTEYYVDV